jgi:hypothetical protein
MVSREVAMAIEVSISVCALILSFLAFCVSIVTLLSERKQKRIDNLITLHEFLHQSDLSEARQSVREGNAEPSLSDPSVRRVCSSFDFAATLVRNGAVDKDMFLDYWRIPLLSLHRIPEQIANAKTGSDVQVREYYKDFWWLLDQAKQTQ